MGAWGDHPKDNDGSADLYYDACSRAAREIDKVFFATRVKDSYAQWDRVGMIQYVVDEMPGCLRFLQDVLKVVRDDIDDILGDKAFLNDWKSPSNTRKNAKAFQKKIDSILSKM